MPIFNGWPWTQFQEQNLDWIIRELNKQQKEIEELQAGGDEYTPLIATAEYIGLEELDTGSLNSAKLDDFIQNGVQEYLYFPDDKVYYFSDPIILTRDIKFIGSGQLKYNGAVLASDYFIETYNRNGNYATIEPQNNHYYFNIDCAGKINGILFNQGIHNHIEAHIRNCYSIGFNDNVSGVGYENNINVTVVNDNDAQYASTIGVYGNHPDNHYETVYTRNCNTAFYARKQCSIGFIHAWVIGDDCYPGSACLRLSGNGVTVDEIYCDTMQYAIYLEALVQRIKINTINAAFNNGAVTAATYASYPYRPWDSAVTPAASEHCEIEIGVVNPMTAHGTYENTLALKEIDGSITVRRPIDYKVTGNFRFIPVTDGIYCAGSALTGLPTGIAADYYTIRSYRGGQYYKVIEFFNDNNADPPVTIWYNMTNGRSIFFTGSKTYIATVAYA